MEEQEPFSEFKTCTYQANMNYPGQKNFDCGNKVINSYVRGSLKQNVRDGNCAAKALIDSKSGELIGVCSFSGYTLEKKRLNGLIQGSLPNELAVVRLVMLGVTIKHQKNGYGQDLLSEFFDQVKQINEVLPIKGVYLDADPSALNFYKRLGFIELNEPPNTFGAIPMFLAIQHILAA